MYKDNIEIENDLSDELLELGIDVMDDPFLNLSPEELANTMIEKQKAEKERKEKEREEKKRAALAAKRIALLNDNDAFNQYDKFIRDFPQFDDIDVHWTGNLVRILHIIKYKHHVDNLANANKIIGDIESISYLAIVKSHLSIATFDDIWLQTRDYVLENPEATIEDAKVDKQAVAYVLERVYKLDESSETSSDPEWGSW
jgi:hypothetical protein